ncbi:MAG: DUF2069 domain-containing protein [Pseudomonadota bacterium]
MPVFSGLMLNRVLLACCLALLLLFAIPVFVMSSSVGLWLMQSIPLLITIPGLLRHSRRSLQWLGFLTLFYLLEAILQIFSPLLIARSIGILSTLFCILLFTAVIVSLKTPKHHAADQ